MYIYKGWRIIQFYPETTHLYAFVWLNLSLSLGYVARASSHPPLLGLPTSYARQFIPSLLVLSCSLLHLSSESLDNPNVVSCFNFQHRTRRSTNLDVSLPFSLFLSPSTPPPPPPPPPPLSLPLFLSLFLSIARYNWDQLTRSRLRHS